MHCKVREDVVVEERALEAWSPSRKQHRERGGRKKVYGWVSGRERRRVGKEKKNPRLPATQAWGGVGVYRGSRCFCDS